MTVKTTKLGGTNWSDGDILYAADLNDSWFGFLSEDTGNEVNTTTSETSSVQITIPANTVKYGILILADVRPQYFHNVSGTITFTARLGTDAATPTNNASVASVSAAGQGAATALTRACGSISKFYTGATWTSTNYIDITVTPSVSDNEVGGVCQRLTIMYF